jgi:S-formylglutathione hydrolase FrmB
MDEVIPQVARRFDASSDRVALGGISMGGFGAYDLARLHPGRFCAVGGHSPALWESAHQTAEGAFDDAEDFARHDVIAAARTVTAAFTSAPIWLDAGDEDPFRAADEAFVSALRAAGAPLTEKTWSGSHEGSYWNSHWTAYLRFYARALRACGR